MADLSPISGMADLAPYPTMFAKRTDWKLKPNELSLRLDEMRKDDIELIDLTESNPTKCGFHYPKEALLSSLAHPENMTYEPSPKGLLQTREAIAAYYQKKGMPVASDRIFLTASTSEAYSFLFRLSADPGENILVPHPSYPLFDFLATLNDLELRSYPLCFNSAWQVALLRLSESIDPKTKAILVVNPNNPTGSFLKSSELSAINKIAREHDLILISDEVFSDYSLTEENGGRVSSVVTNSSVLTFVLGGISKALGLPQMKLAWMVANGPKDLLKKATERLEVILDTYLSVNTPVQRSLASWLSFQHEIQSEILARLNQNLEILKHYTQKGACQVLPPEGGWYAVLRIPSSRTEEEWVLEFLSKDRVYVHPGYFFDFEEEAYIVLSLLPPKDIFEEGTRRILARISKVG